MPLVVLCGFPSSGKTRRTNELKKHVETNYPNKKIHIVSDHNNGVERNSVYAESRREKEVRGSLKSTAQRLLNKEDVVILDSLNYIKGFRYELFCVTKACHTPHCVIFCDISSERASEFNLQRDEQDRYTQDIFDGLVMRFESPNSSTRWDSPLFVVQVEDDLPTVQICQALFDRKPPPPNQSTQSQPLSSTNFLYELDRITQETLTAMMEAQKMGLPGDKITIPGATEKIELTRTITLSELHRQRRQFITYTKMHPVEDTARLANMFVQYLNNSLR
ncbi:protein KTI12 homolog [Haliotis rufescens]|uniref:protein KTI12 homolog n=1 Tax=Haliotis rufescens TaxID=6454 RepID=UPI00201EE51C|nr:protein KTI12 homolog [Haliotis rufescens]